MKLINPKGKEVEMNESKGKKFLSLRSKIKQGWKKATEKKDINKNSLANLKPKTAKKPVAKKATEKKK